jgi:hypothetical protein
MATSIVVQSSTPEAPTNAAFGTNAFGRLASAGDLSIANGMTAGYGDNDGNVSNPPAWPGTYGRWPGQPQRIGVLRNLAGSAGGGNAVYSLYFIFNPNQIVVNFATNPGQIPPSYLYSGSTPSSLSDIATANGGTGTASSATVPNFTNSQTVSWSLIFDRTYDMIFDTNPDENRGVLKDVAALYNLMGSFDGQAGVPVSTPCQVVFAETASSQLWGFTGFISVATITYGIFRHNMIPSRCEIDLQMTTVYTAATQPTLSSAQPLPVTGSNGNTVILPSGNAVPPQNLVQGPG